MTNTSAIGRGQVDGPMALVVKSLSKTFGGEHALQDVTLAIRTGEIHGLLGENGSGKSTLIKILCGYHAPDSGELEIEGRPVPLPLAPGAFQDLALGFVHQDLGLVSSLTVVENLRLADLARNGGRLWISWAAERRKARETFRRYGLELDPAEQVGNLRPIERALVAIIRAVEDLARSASAGVPTRGVLVLDEPTVFLPKTGTDQLFSLMRDLAHHGASVLFVSHDLDQMREVTNRITVLRDGRVVGTVETAATDEKQLIEMIIGRRLAALSSRRNRTVREVNGEVQNIRTDTLAGVSFSLHLGEILGVTGLAGSGFEDVPYALFGAHANGSGTLELGGVTFDVRALTPARAINSGMALVPADRTRDGSVGSLTVADNVTLPVLDRYFNGLALRRRAVRKDAQRLLRKFDVRPPDPTVTYSTLSGGNQQKVLLAKWLQLEPVLLLLHEPTQGVDVGARHQIFDLIRQATERAMTVVCASADYEQLGLICDRVLIVARGSIIEELIGEDVTKDRITEQCLNSVAFSGSLEVVS